MGKWLRKFAAGLPDTVPAKLKVFLDEIGQRLEHLAALSFGLTFCHLSYISVVVNKHPFGAQEFGIGAAAIMGCWATILYWKKPADPPGG